MINGRAGLNRPAIFDAEACAVRVYCFCPATGVYQGEDFLDECQLESTEGITSIAPPNYVRGEVPVFYSAAQRWEVMKLSGKGISKDKS